MPYAIVYPDGSSSPELAHSSEAAAVAQAAMIAAGHTYYAQQLVIVEVDHVPDARIFRLDPGTGRKLTEFSLAERSLPTIPETVPDSHSPIWNSRFGECLQEFFFRPKAIPLHAVLRAARGELPIDDVIPTGPHIDVALTARQLDILIGAAIEVRDYWAGCADSFLPSSAELDELEDQLFTALVALDTTDQSEMPDLDLDDQD